MQTLPWIAGGLNPHKAPSVGKLFVLDLEDPNPALREACLLAFQVLGLPEKAAAPGAGRFHTLWVEHPAPATRDQHLQAFLVYLDHCPVLEERQKWFTYLSQSTSRLISAAYEHARHARFNDADAALKEAAGHDKRFQIGAGLDKAKADVKRMKADHKAAADAKAEQAYLQAQHRLSHVLSLVPPDPATGQECGEAQAARRELLHEWQQLPRHLQSKHAKPVA